MIELKEPLYTYPNESTKSGVIVRKVPKAKATGSKATDDGQDDQSSTGPRNTFMSFHCTLREPGKDSGSRYVKINAMMPNTVDPMNMASNPYSTVNQLPSAGPPAIPALPATPRYPSASPLRFNGVMSVRKAVVPVGRKPVLIPCKSRSNKKHQTAIGNEPLHEGNDAA